MSGIFIKHVSPDSAAGRAGGLVSGDLVLEIDGASMVGRDHRAAAAAIKAAGEDIAFVVQSHDQERKDTETPARKTPQQMVQVCIAN